MRLHLFKVVAVLGLFLLIGGEFLTRQLGYPERIQPIQYVEGLGHVLDPVSAFDPTIYEGGCDILMLGDSILADIRPHMETTLETATQNDPKFAKCRLINVSIGGWSPSGMRKWIDRFGWMNADHVIFVFNSDDLTQPPSDDPRRMSATYDRHDRLALTAWFRNVILRRIDNRLHHVERYAGAGTPDMEQILLDANSAVGSVEVFWHPRLNDTLEGALPPEEFVIAARAVSAPLTALDYGPEDYADRIHLNEAGKVKMARQVGQILSRQTTTVHAQIFPE